MTSVVSKHSIFVTSIVTGVGFKHSTFVTAIVVIVSKPLFLLLKIASLYNANFANGL